MKALILALTIAAAAQAQDRPGLPLPSSGNVTLPLDEYNRLLELAAQPVKRTGFNNAPPMPYTMKSAALKMEVAADSATASIQLEGDVLAQGIAKVPLVSGMTVLDAQQRGKELPLQQSAGTHTAVLDGPSEFSISLAAGFPLTIEPGRASFNLTAPAAGSVRLTLSVQGDHTNVSLSPGLVTSRASVGGRTTIEATLVPGRVTTIWWATRESSAPPASREVRFLSDVKTLVSVGEAQLGVAALADITVVQGEPSQFEFEIPAGFEVTGATGASLESSEVQSGALILKVSKPTLRSHQFLIAMEKSIDAPKASLPFVSVKGTQRETGEALLEGEGAMELTATETGGLKRMDLRETNPYLRSLAHASLHSAFRYHKQPGETPALSLEWLRFPDSSVLAAVAQQASVTTLVTAEGRSLTEVKLLLSNQAQPFLKVGLPAGASIVSADVGGENVKPVEGPDGNRVPLLRAGFRPPGAYEVSFVFVHSGAPFARKGGSELALPRMDIPIGLLQWEVFLPEQYKVTDFGGDAMPASLLSISSGAVAENGLKFPGDMYDDPLAGPNGGALNLPAHPPFNPLAPGQLGGLILDPTGAGVPRVSVTVTVLSTGAVLTAATDRNGHWVVANLPSGRVRITASSPGFQTAIRELTYDAVNPAPYNLALQVGSASESVEVTANSPMIVNGSVSKELDYRQAPRPGKKDAAADTGASADVLNLQRRVAGVLPIRVDVPRAGKSFRFVRPLVIDEETKVTFTYKSGK